MSDDALTRSRIIEFVNILFAAVAWILPDIPIIIKIIISMVLLGIAIAGNVKPGLLVPHANLTRFLLLLFLPPLVAIIEYWILKVVSGWSEVQLVLQVGLSYGLCVALP